MPAPLFSATFDSAILPKWNEVAVPLQELVRSFSQNAIRSKSGLGAISFLSVFITIYQQAGDQASLEVLKRLPYDEEAHDPRIQKKLHELSTVAMDEWNADTSIWQKHQSRAEDNIEKILLMHAYNDSKLGVFFRAAIQRLYQDMIVSAWTAIEVMIADLARAAIKIRNIQKPFTGEPWRILEMVESARGIKTENRPENRPTQVSFSSLQNARISYARVFALDSSEILGCMADLDFDGLYLVRNQFVHEGGR